MTQAEKILWHIEEFGSITALEAMNEYGIMRLASRISDLKRLGYPIDSKVIEVKNRFGEACHVKSYYTGGADNG